MHGNYVEYNTLTVAVSRIKAKLGTYGEKHQAYIETIRNVGYVPAIVAVEPDVDCY